MSVTTPAEGRGLDRADRDHPAAEDSTRRLSAETKAAFKTTEFMAYLAVLAGILIAGAVAKAGHYAGAHDPLRADRVWLYATILTVGYMISRGLAKAGTRDRYDERS
jgi:hypothetical protein